MGRYTYPSVRDEAPSEHVEKFFQVNTHTHTYTLLPSKTQQCFSDPLISAENGQKSRWRGDHRGVHRDVSEGIDSRFVQTDQIMTEEELYHYGTIF